MNDLDSIGFIIKLDNDEVIAVTDESIFVRIKKKPGMYLGQNILIKKGDLLPEKKNRKKYLTYAAYVAAAFTIVFALVFLYGKSFYMDLTYAYVSVDINPSIELKVNKKDTVIDVRTLNNDAQQLVRNLKVKNLKVDEALNRIVKKSEDDGYLKPGDEKSCVLISIAFKETNTDNDYEVNHEKQLTELLQDVKKDLDKNYGSGVKSLVVKVPVLFHNNSEDSNISMGKYLIYNRAKEMGKDISMEELKEGELYMLLKKINILQDSEKEPIPTMPVFTPTPIQASSNPNTTETPGIQAPSATSGEVVKTPGNSEPLFRTTPPKRTSIPQPTVSVTEVPNKTKDPETKVPETNPSETNPPVTNPPITNPPVTKAISLEEIKKPGLKGEYYDNMDFTELKTVRSDPSIDFRWGEDAPDDNVGADTFSVRWTGKIIPRYSENYTFYTYADDGARLWVNNVLLIDNWKSQRPVESTGSLELKAGNQYDIRLEYFENVKSGQVKLYWSSSSQAKEIIPESQLFHMAEVYQAEQAALSGSFVENINAGYSGVGYVNYENEPNGYIEWKIETSKSGTYTLNFRYSNATKANRTVEIKLNDNVVKSQMDFKPTGAWTKWQDNRITVHLNAGVNTIRVRATSSDGGPNIDYMELVRY